MSWCCDICDKVIHEEFSNNHLQSGFYKRSAKSVISKYIITTPKPKKIDDLIRKFLRSH